MLIVSGMVRTHRYPFTAAAIESPIPVLPDVGSMIVPPFFNKPDLAASSIMLKHILSLTLPPGLKFSSFANISAESAGAILFNLTIGVSPINSKTLFAILSLKGIPATPHVIYKFDLISFLQNCLVIFRLPQDLFIQLHRYNFKPYPPALKQSQNARALFHVFFFAVNNYINAHHRFLLKSLNACPSQNYFLVEES